MTAVVLGPVLTPPTISILSAAEIVPTADDRWFSGFSYQSDGCGDNGSALYPVCPPDQNLLKSFCADDGIAEFFPYVIFGSSTCSTYGSVLEEHVERARRRLLAGEAFWLEAALWGGANVPTEIAGLGNPTLAAATTTVVSAGGMDPVRALAALEDALGDKIRGQAMIHMRPGMLTRLVAADALRRVGNLWLTAMDHIVVPGAGYPGSGPTGQVVNATEWMYASSVVQIRRSAITTLPGADEPRYFGVHRSTNDLQAIAERVAHVALPPCAIFAAEVNR